MAFYEHKGFGVNRKYYLRFAREINGQMAKVGSRVTAEMVGPFVLEEWYEAGFLYTDDHVDDHGFNPDLIYICREKIDLGGKTFSPGEPVDADEVGTIQLLRTLYDAGKIMHEQEWETAKPRKKAIPKVAEAQDDSDLPAKKKAGKKKSGKKKATHKSSN